LGKDRTNLGTLEATTTSVDASGATGGLTVTASATKTSIIGSQAADTITGGGAADTIQGGKGADTLSGGAGADTYVFAATGALNGADVLTIVAADDILNFSAFLAGGSVDVNLATGTAINEYTIANTSDVAIANKVVMYSDADATLIDDASEIALLIQGAGDAFSLASGGKSIVITGDAGSADDVARIWFIDDSLDGTLGTIGTADVVLVGVTAAGFDVDTLLNTKFTF
jgi:Ca2+-binding RTX toxin-like protein